MICTNCKKTIHFNAQVSETIYVCPSCKTILLVKDQQLIIASEHEIAELLKVPELVKDIEGVNKQTPFPKFFFTDNIPTMPGCKFIISVKASPLMIFSINQGSNLEFFAVFPGQPTPATAERIQKIKLKAQHWYHNAILKKTK